jgi:hypothetical protein
VGLAEGIGPRRREELLCFLVHRRLVVLERQNIVPTAIDDATSNLSGSPSRRW